MIGKYSLCFSFFDVEVTASSVISNPKGFLGRELVIENLGLQCYMHAGGINEIYLIKKKEEYFWMDE